MGADDRGETAESPNTDDPLAGTRTRPSVIDCVLYSVLLFAITAIAVGLFVLLLDVIDQDTLGLTVEATDPADFEDLFENGFATEQTLADDHGVSILLTIGVLGIVGSTFVGVLFGWVAREDDRTVTLAAAGSAFAAAAVLWVLVGFLGGLFTGLTEVLGDLFINGILLGISAMIAAAGSAWLTRMLVRPTSASTRENW